LVINLTAGLSFIRLRSLVPAPSSVDKVIKRNKDYADIYSIEKALHEAENKSPERQPLESGKHRFKKAGHSMKPRGDNQPVEHT
jgi:hypothetical protein